MTQKEINIKKNPPLTIELVPPSAWYVNLRNITDKATWSQIKRITFKEYSNKCAICGGQGEQWPVECHEQWMYDDIDHIQYLKKTVALCPDCHSVKHWGYTELQGDVAIERAVKHICKINKWGVKDLSKYLSYISDVFHIRSQYEWVLDIKSLVDIYPFVAQDGKFRSLIQKEKF